jgi:hypothetical protein
MMAMMIFSLKLLPFVLALEAFLDSGKAFTGLGIML